jgi:hypothetical protein
MVSVGGAITLLVLKDFISQQSCSPGQEIVKSPVLQAPSGWPGSISAAAIEGMAEKMINEKTLSTI